MKGLTNILQLKVINDVLCLRAFTAFEPFD